MPKKTDLEAKFEAYWNMLADSSLPDPEQQVRFHPVRQWRFDFAWPDQKLAVEIEGGVYKRGRHNRASGFIKDCDKYNAAVECGWRLLRYTVHHIDNDPSSMIEQVEATLKSLS